MRYHIHKKEAAANNGNGASVDHTQETEAQVNTTDEAANNCMLIN